MDLKLFYKQTVNLDLSSVSFIKGVQEKINIKVYILKKKSAGLSQLGVSGTNE